MLQLSRTLVVIFGFCLFGSAALGQDLFLPLDAKLVADLQRTEPKPPATTKRLRYVRLNAEYFRSVVLPSAKTAEGKEAKAIRLTLFEDTSIDVFTSALEHTNGIYVWTGWAKAENFGQVRLTVGGSVASGTVQFDNRLFEIQPIGAGVVAIAELDPSRFPPEGRPRVPKKSTRRGAADTVKIPAADKTSATIKVLVILPTPTYNFLCSKLLGIDLRQLVASSYQQNLNGVFSAVKPTGVTADVVVRCKSYKPVGGDLGSDLDWVRTNTDVASLRNLLKADLVSLIVPDSSICGLGYYNFPVEAADAPWAFSVVKGSCALSNYSFAHELGHNMGMQHDRVAEGLETSDLCNFGSIFSNPTGRSVMSYGSSCNNCTRYGLYSTPLKWTISFWSFSWTLGPFGTSCSDARQADGTYRRANNRQQLINAAPTVAAFR